MVLRGLGEAMQMSASRRPGEQRLNKPQLRKDIAEVSLHDSLDIPIELGAPGPRIERANPREPRNDDLVDVANQACRAPTGDPGMVAPEQLPEAHRPRAEVPLGEGQRPHRELHDPSGAGMGRRAGGSGAAGET